MAKRDRGYMLQLDSLTDISTCMLGCLMMIILLTGIDAMNVKMLIPTPMEHVSDRKPIFIECRNNELFRVPVAELRKLADDQLKAIADEAKGDSALMLQKLAASAAQTDAYKVDLTYALLGQFAIVPVATAKGYALVDATKEKPTDWFGKILTSMNLEKEMLTFLVRDNSYDVFKRARALAWYQKAEVSYELLDVQAPIKFGLGGSRSLAQ